MTVFSTRKVLYEDRRPGSHKMKEARMKGIPALAGGPAGAAAFLFRTLLMLICIIFPTLSHLVPGLLARPVPHKECFA